MRGITNSISFLLVLIEHSFSNSNGNHIDSEDESIEAENEIAHEIEAENDNRIEEGTSENTKEDIETEIYNEISVLQEESMTQKQFVQSLEQFWTCNEEELARLVPEIVLSTNENNKKIKSKVRIPKSRSALNFSNVKSRYMDVFKKN